MWQLVINGPGYFDTLYELPEGETTLGRADENDVILSGELVSRRHVRIVVEGGSVTVGDLGSRNGSSVNDQPLGPSRIIGAGDVLTIGENTLTLHRVSRAAAPTLLHYGEGIDIGPAVLVAKDVGQRTVLDALDNISPSVLEGGATPLELDSPLSFGALALLYRVVEALAASDTLEVFLEETANLVLEGANAQTAVILLRDPSGALVPSAVRHRGSLAEGEVPVSDAVVRAALEKRAALAVTDARGDERFNQSHSVLMYGVDQVICVPIGREAPFEGVLYLNRPPGSGGELEPLVDLCTAVARLLQTGLARFRRSQDTAQRVRSEAAESRFYGPAVLKRSSAGSLTGLRAGRVTVLSARLTAPSHGWSVEAAAGFAGFLSWAADVVLSFEGVTSVLCGEGLRAVFGDPAPRGDDGLRALRAAIHLRREWARRTAALPEEQATSVASALHTAEGISGLVTSERRTEHLVLGEAAEVAGRLSAVTPGGGIWITAKTLAVSGARFDVTPLGEKELGPAGRRLAAFSVDDEGGDPDVTQGS